MYYLRPKWISERLQPDFRFIRTLQSPWHLVRDEATGRYRISSKAFGPSKSDGTVSGDLEEILIEDGLDATTMYPAVRDPVGAASLTVEQVLSVGAQVSHIPVSTNWYHGGIAGTKRGRVKERLREMAQEIIPIDQARAREFHERTTTLGNSSP